MDSFRPNRAHRAIPPSVCPSSHYQPLSMASTCSISHRSWADCMTTHYNALHHRATVSLTSASSNNILSVYLKPQNKTTRCFALICYDFIINKYWINPPHALLYCFWKHIDTDRVFLELVWYEHHQGFNWRIFFKVAAKQQTSRIFSQWSSPI